MRISKQQMKLLRKCGQMEDVAICFTKQEDQDAACYLVTRNFLKKTSDDPPLFQITEEGKAYAYEFHDMRLHRSRTDITSYAALAISIIALLMP